jgi:hypothetical protein
MPQSLTKKQKENIDFFFNEHLEVYLRNNLLKGKFDITHDQLVLIYLLRFLLLPFFIHNY